MRTSDLPLDPPCKRSLEPERGALGDPRVTSVLQAAARGDTKAAAELLPLVYEDLRRLARSRMARLKPGQTLQPTALVHEAYLRVAGEMDPRWDGRGHFFGAAARAMRDILVDQARRKHSQKRGGGQERISTEDSELMIEPPAEDVRALDDAVKRLEAEDPRKGQLINLRYFARLSNEETAAALGLSVKTIEREWRFIRAWLQHELGKAGHSEIR